MSALYTRGPDRLAPPVYLCLSGWRSRSFDHFLIWLITWPLGHMGRGKGTTENMMMMMKT